MSEQELRELVRKFIQQEKENLEACHRSYQYHPEPKSWAEFYDFYKRNKANKDIDPAKIFHLAESGGIPLERVNKIIHEES